MVVILVAQSAKTKYGNFVHDLPYIIPTK